jgi:hypothetical protein
MIQDQQLREVFKRSTGTKRKLQSSSRTVDVLAVARCEKHNGEEGAVDEHHSQEDTVETEKRDLDVKAILDEVVYKGVHTSITKGSASSEEKHKEGTDEYDPETPQLALPLLLQRIAQVDRIRKEREATQPYIHNPHYLYHIFSDAPYTVHRCRRCTRRRKCTLHREIFQQQTSISLCPHVRMNLYWAINDPVNAHSSWNLQVKEYFGESRDGYWSRYEDEKQRAEHKLCVVQPPSWRIKTLAERAVEDMEKERGRKLRGNVRRVGDEIGVLLGAWERGVVSRESIREEEKIERKERVRAKELRIARANEQLMKTLQLVEEMERMKESKDGIEEKEVVQSVEDEAAQTHTSPSLPAQFTPPKSASPPATPDYAPTKLGPASHTPKAFEALPFPSPSTQSSILTTRSPSPLASPTPPTSLPNKRKRSTSLPPSPSNSPKRVRRTHDTEALLDAEQPPIVSPEYVPDEGGYSSATSEEEREVVRMVSAEGLEDLVDWGEGSGDEIAQG